MTPKALLAAVQRALRSQAKEAARRKARHTPEPNPQTPYQRRIARGLARGLSRSAAAGHPRPGEPGPSACRQLAALAHSHQVSAVTALMRGEEPALTAEEVVDQIIEQIVKSRGPSFLLDKS